MSMGNTNRDIAFSCRSRYPARTNHLSVSQYQRVHATVRVPSDRYRHFDFWSHFKLIKPFAQQPEIKSISLRKAFVFSTVRNGHSQLICEQTCEQGDGEVLGDFREFANYRFGTVVLSRENLRGKRDDIRERRLPNLTN